MALPPLCCDRLFLFEVLLADLFTDLLTVLLADLLTVLLTDLLTALFWLLRSLFAVRFIYTIINIKN